MDDGERGRHAWHEAQRFYKQNGYQLAWSDGTRPRGQLDGLVRAIRAADRDGLDPQDYHVDESDATAIEPIVMNMERWRWLPDDLGSRYPLVNIPAFRLDAIENGKSALDMKVVTGKKTSPTPVLADRMTTVVFSPYWNIPQDIVQKEILPKIERDPGYLEIFNRVERDFSHGCVRLDEPMDLAR